MRVLEAIHVAERLPYARLIEALRSGLAQRANVPQRVSFRIDDAASVLVMPAWNDRYLGIKSVNVFPRNAGLGKPAIASTYLLSDGRTGETLALIDGDALTRRRTAAVAALAASFLAPTDAAWMLLVGSGHAASEMPAAFAEVLPIKRVSVASRTAANAASLADELAARGFDASVCSDLAADASTAPVIVCATFATQPLISGRWLRPDAHLSLIGGFRPTMREADSAAIANGYVVADSRAGVLAEAGDLLIPIGEGLIDASHVRADLGELCRGEHCVADKRDRPTIFKSVGHASQDLIAASLCLD